MVDREPARSHDSNAVRIEVLGPCRARRGEVVLDLAPTKPNAVLAVLVASDRHTATDARLLDEIWGREADRSGLDTLKNAVYQLNRRFDDAFGLRPIAHGGAGYSLIPELIRVDADEFSAAVNEIEFADASAGDRLARSEHVLALWRSEPLPGFDEMPTVDSLRRSLVSAHYGARKAWAAAAVDVGQHDVALVSIEQLAADHPDDEHVCSILMRAYARSGRQRDALRAYEDLRRRIGEESGIEPSADLNALYLDLLLGRTGEGVIAADSSDGHMHAGAADPPTDAPVLPAELTRMARRPFSGREDEVVRVRHVASAPPDAGPGLVVISGAPGIGKTRLMAAIVSELTATGLQVRYARCLPELDRATGAIGQLFPDQGSEVDTPSGHLAAGLSDVLVNVDVRLGYRQRLALAARRAHDTVDISQRTVLCVEDAQWLDNGSQMVLSDLLAESVPVTVIMTCRPEAIRPGDSGTGGEELDSTDLGSWLDGMQWEELALGPLDDAAVLPLVQAVLPMRFRHRAAATVELIQRQARGIPILVTEVLNAVDRQVSSSRSFSLGAIEAVVPDDLQGAVERSMRRLTAEGREALKAAAVAGMRAELDIVAAVLDLDEDAVAASLEEAVSEQLITDRTGRLGEYQFIHDLHRSAVLGELGVNRRVRLHRRYAEVIEVRRGRSGVRDRAAHLVQAVPLVDGGDAVTASLAAAQDAVARFDVEDAVRLLHRALAVTHEVTVPAGLRCDVLTALAALEAWIGEREAARDHFEAALAISDDIGDVERRATLLLAVDADNRVVLTLADRRELLIDVNRTLGDAEPTPLSVSVRARLLGEAVMPGRYIDTGIDAHELVATARTLDDNRALTDALFAAHVATRASSDLGARSRLTNEFVELTTDADPGFTAELESLGCRIYDLFGGGRFDEAITATRRMAQLARERSVARFAWRAKVVQSALLRATGQNDAADMLAGEALIEGKGVGGADANAVFAMQTHDSLRHQGALGSLVDALRLAAGQTEVVVIHLLLAQALAHADDLDGARREWAAWRDAALALPPEDLWLPTKALAAELVATGVGNAADAVGLAAELAPFGGQWVPVGIPVATWGPVDAYLGLLTGAQGDVADADRLLRSAMAQCEAAGAGPWRVWAAEHANALGL
ncbi:MAG: BTAD domain-containing putative transcriptional regulator [Actinomycetota bacterium]